MALSFGNELLPYMEILLGPFVWPLGEDVVRQDVIVPKCRDNRNDKVICWIVVVKIVRLAKDLQEFLHKQLVLRSDLLFAPREFLVIVVASRVSGPDDEVNVVFQRRVDPFECLVQEADGAVAICGLGTVEACGSRASMASLFLLGGRVDFVIGVWMDVCSIFVIILA